MFSTGERNANRRAARVVAATALMLVGLGACSDDETATGTNEGGAPPAATAAPVTAVTPDPQLPLSEYYLQLGVPPAIVDCYVPALDELGVTSVLQLEQDQELGARAAELFAACAAASG